MLRLHQFPASHFNEKARWALDYKSIAHERVNYLPGPHIPQIRKLSNGKSTTPVLQDGELYISGSADILLYTEQHYPEPALYPVDSQQRQAALDIQTNFDQAVGPAVRTLVFSVLLNEPGHLASTFTAGQPALKRYGYRLLLPFARPLIRKGNGVNPLNIKKSRTIVQDALTDVSKWIAEKPYIVGDSFTVADLTVASLLAPLASVDHPDMKRPKPVPVAFTQLLAEYQDHPAMAWVREMYESKRPDCSADKPLKLD